MVIACGEDPDVDFDAYSTLGAKLVWQSPGGFAGTGPALTILSDGAIHMWDNVGAFDPEVAQTSFDRTIYVAQPMLRDLFARWANTDAHNLPHAGGPVVECDPVLYVRTCSTCTPTRIDYNHAQQLDPEMEQVWAWFDSTLVNEQPANNPRNFCRL